MLVISRRTGLAAAAGLVAVFGVSGCTTPAAPVVVEQPVVVAPQFSVNEQDFIDLARQEGGYGDYADDELVDLGYSACDQLEAQPDLVLDNYDPSFVSLAVTALCPELEDNYVYLTQ